MHKVPATQVVARGRLEFVDATVPAPKVGEVLVRPLLISLCGSDVRRLYYAPLGQYPFPVGTTGHEIVALVEEVNAEQSTLRPGDLALVLSPQENGMVEHYVASAEHVLSLPAGRPLEHLLMAQQLGTVIYSCKRLGSVLDKNVVVIGQGSAGLFWDAMCRRMGARRVIGMDLQEARVRAAYQFGATHAVNNGRADPVSATVEILGGSLADIVVEAAGEASAICLAPQLVRESGVLFYFGIPRVEKLEFDFGLFFRKYSHTMSMAGPIAEPGLRSFRQAIEMLANGELDVAPMLTHRVPFERAPEALELARTCGDGAIKIVVEMPGFRATEARRSPE